MLNGVDVFTRRKKHEALLLVLSGNWTGSLPHYFHILCDAEMYKYRPSYYLHSIVLVTQVSNPSLDCLLATISMLYYLLRVVLITIREILKSKVN